MRLTTPVALPENELEISYSTKQMIIGSCFAENIGGRLVACKFPVMLNPFGILYNPLSIATALERMEECRLFTENSTELTFHEERWHSMLHHGDFSRAGKEELIENINSRLTQASKWIKETELLSLTFGTAYVYRRKSDNMVVGNCHKIPSTQFERSLLSPSEIVTAMSIILERLFSRNYAMKVMLTVSPIRHFRDGAHGNQVSKATLLLAVDELQKRFPGKIFYFPSYEIVLDELRDYRFYAEDMLHPSPIAANYIWERFGECYFSEETKSIAAKVEEINRALAHRPINGASAAHADFKSKLLLKIERLTEKYPFFDFSKETEQLKNSLSYNF